MSDYPSNVSPLSRTGCHYFLDCEHYTQRDLAAWLPELRRLGFGWLALNAPARRAIPEYFIAGLLEAGIQPVLRFHLSLKEPAPEDLDLLYESYSRWGVRFIDLFSAPNVYAAWPPSDWVHTDLVERFLDRFLPLAEHAGQKGLTPLFPCLEPGGDYWDLAFLQAGLAGVQRRAPGLARTLGLAARATFDRPLAWGAGGPERWPSARPYFTPKGSQDQQGFRIFEWYAALAQARLGFSPSIFLFCEPGRSSPGGGEQAARSLAAARLPTGLACEEDGQTLEPVVAPVAAGCLWLLTTPAGSALAGEALFPPDSEPHPCVPALRELAGLRQLSGLAKQEGISKSAGRSNPGQGKSQPSGLNDQTPHLGRASDDSQTHTPAQTPINDRPIAHYLLLPAYDWGLDEVWLTRLLPFIRQHRPALGFSVLEARLAQRVSVAGGLQAYPDEDLAYLSNAGCRVERLLPDGTIIA